MRWNRTKENYRKLNIRKYILTVKSIRLWTNFPREVVEALSLESFKTQDKALKNIVEGTALLQLEWDKLNGLKELFNLNLFYSTIKYYALFRASSDKTGKLAAAEDSAYLGTG